MIFVFLLWVLGFCEAHAFDHEKNEASGFIKAIESVPSYKDLNQIPDDKISSYQTFLNRLSILERQELGIERPLSFLEQPLDENAGGGSKAVFRRKIGDLKLQLAYKKNFYKGQSDLYIEGKILEPLSRLIVCHREIELCVQKICFPHFCEPFSTHPDYYETKAKKENLLEEFRSFQPIYHAFAQKVIDILTWRGQMSSSQTYGVFYEDKPNSTGACYRFVFFKDNNALDVFYVAPYLPLFSCSFLPMSFGKDTDQIREMYFQYGRRVEDKALIIGRDKKDIFCAPYLGKFSHLLEDGRMLPPFRKQETTHRKGLVVYHKQKKPGLLYVTHPMLSILKDELDKSAAVYRKYLCEFGQNISPYEVDGTIVLPVELVPQHETLYTLLFLEYLMEEAGEEVETQKRDVQGAIQGNTPQPSAKVKGKSGRKKASKPIKHEGQSGSASPGASDAKEGATQKDEHGLNPSPALSSKAAWLEAKEMQRRIEEASQAKIEELHRSLAQELKEQVKKDYAQRIAKEQKERQEAVANQPSADPAQKAGKQTKKGRAPQGGAHKKTPSSSGKDLQKHQEAIIDKIVAEEKESGRIKYRVAHKILGKLMMRGQQEADVSTQTQGSHTVIHTEGGQSVTVPRKHGQKDATIPTTRLKNWMRGLLSNVGSSFGRSEATSPKKIQ
ncbi:hypothetical protein EIL50_03480 [bacterium NHP-B]|nr:hypothetical protein EIL50_03480 [bacterium NHP-B]